jgi:hypothetical protein
MENITNDPKQQIKVIIRSAKQRDRRLSLTKFSKIDISPEVFFQHLISKV